MRTFGTVSLDSKRRKWLVRTEPAVAMRMKRLFAKIDATERGVLKITANQENSRELEWFLLRYPMVVNDAPELAGMASEHREQEATVTRILTGEATLPAIPMKLPAREYQRLVPEMVRASRGLLLADDVGLGKTVSAIATLAALPDALPALITCPTHLPQQWLAELNRFLGFRVHILTRATAYDLVKASGGSMPDVVISNYAKLPGWAGTLAGLIRFVVWDEAQAMRRSDSQRYAAGREIADKAKYQLAMSATPLHTQGADMFNIIDLVRPDALGSRDEFAREWCKRGSQDKLFIKDPRAFGMYLRDQGLMLRRTGKEVQREVPQSFPVPHHVDADPSVLMRMKGRAVELARLIMSKGEKFRGEKMQASAEFDIRMRQDTGLAKAPYVAEFVRFLHEASGEKIVLFGWHREVYDIWMDKLADLNPALYTGSESPKQKEEARERFIRGDAKVIIISLGSGAGLDGLQYVSHLCVFGELDWSPATHEQCVGRVARDGQDKPVFAYYLLSEHGSDPVMSDILGVKRQQLEGVRDPNSDLVAKLQVEEDYIKRLAERFLLDNGEDVPERIETTA